jgi:regulator of replication initiation timing
MSKSVEARIVSLKERIKALSTQIRRTEESGEKALRIETKELRRRLGDLNGEASRLKQIQETTISREKFDMFKEDLFKQQNTKDEEVNRRFGEIIDNRIRPLEDFKQNFQGRVTMLGIVWGIIVVLFSWYLSKH